MHRTDRHFVLSAISYERTHGRFRHPIKTHNPTAVSRLGGRGSFPAFEICLRSLALKKHKYGVTVADSERAARVRAGRGGRGSVRAAAPPASPGSPVGQRRPTRGTAGTA